MATIALLNIGSELLTGRTVNTNASTMAIMLRAVGFDLKTTVVCHDTNDGIRGWLDELMKEHEIVLVTGGLGPTKDDITKKVLLERFGGEMVCHEPTLEMISQYLMNRGRTILESNRLQSFVPSSCTVLQNTSGTAPGMAFTEGGNTVISMPGVPLEMQHLMENKVLPFLLERYSTHLMLTRTLRTAGVPESRLGERMAEIESEAVFQGVDIAYLPGYDGTKIELRMKADPREKEAREAQMDAVQKRIADFFSKYVYSLADKTPDKILAEKLLSSGTTFGTAESCTGGAIAARMVLHSGISAVMKGGVVAYMRSIKEEVLGVPAKTIDDFGIVSEATAMAMAEGARKLLKSDIAVSITGIAEATEDAPAEEQPQAWVGYADVNGSSAYHIKLSRKREQSIQVAVNAALLYVLKKMEG